MVIKQLPILINLLSHLWFYLLYWKSFVKGQSSRKRVGETLSTALYSFDRELMKGCSSSLWDSCGMSLAYVSSFYFICILLCFTVHFIIIFSWMLLSRKDSIHVYCSALGKRSLTVYLLLSEKDSLYMPFSASQQSFHSI